jgi:hypothetical protein
VARKSGGGRSKAGSGRSAESPKFLIVRKKRGEVFFVTPDRLGAPVRDDKLDDAIDAYKKLEGSMEGVDFALLIPETEALMRVAMRASKNQKD